ncbi:MAG TPA: DUF2059 domain-containing protein [Terracidiphilus sp.]|nr:DUF2059 domain-containing protein [Terracidiphilus sp.]
MNARLKWAAVIGLVLAPMLSFGQAIAVSPSGAMAQESATPGIAPEDQPTKEQLTKLFEVMRIRDQMQNMRKIVPAMIETQMRAQIRAMSAEMSPGSKTTADQRAAVERLLHKYVDKAERLYPVDEMIDDASGLYRKYLSREDVDALIAFYSSAAGQHLLDAQPKIAQEYMPLVMQRTQERTKTLTAEMMKDLAALKNSTPAQPAQK